LPSALAPDHLRVMCKRIIKHEEGWPALKLFARG
jgi:hypothetical protein